MGYQDPPLYPSSNPEIRKYEDNYLINRAFLLACWNAQATENARMLEEIKKEARYRSLKNPDLPKTVQSSISNGELAHSLEQKYTQKLKEEGNSERVNAWLKTVTECHHESVAHHLGIVLKKWLNFQSNRQSRIRNPETHNKITIPPVKLGPNGEHPNSLREMMPATEWDILIDEAGTAFDEQVMEIEERHTEELGRFVALAIPDKKQLAPLKSGFHAKDEDPQELQQVLSNLLLSEAGVFGFMANDPAMNSRTYWMSHIYNLMRWVLLLLPVPENAPVRVRFRVEQRGDYTPSTNLKALQEVLENEVKDVDPKRFAQLQLDLALIGKSEHPANGYVDTIANFWASPNPFKKRLLEHTRLLGPCLLNPRNRDALERLYAALNTQRTFLPDLWYQACAKSPNEAAHSLLGSYLKRLGEQTQKDVGLWRSYLKAIQYRLATKNYRLDSLGRALDWLETYAPAEQKLPLPMELQLLTARLSLANHRGQTQPEMLSRAFMLANDLKDENAPLACETLLRLAVSGSNAFQFKEVQAPIASWLELPVAVPGLLNHAKLHSTLGQLLAFQGKPKEAIPCFEKALECFERLSDPEQAAREITQTLNYRLCALMDSEDLENSEVLQSALSNYLGRVTQRGDLTEQVKVLARSGDTLNRVFAHQLLLRALITWPEPLASLREIYLSVSEYWQVGEEHPWPLILAYRGWLLFDAKQNQGAMATFSEAVELCERENRGPTLHWMGAVLRQLACSLGMSEFSLSPEQLQNLKAKLPEAPHKRLQASSEKPLELLNRCLPFNFH